MAGIDHVPEPEAEAGSAWTEGGGGSEQERVRFCRRAVSPAEEPQHRRHLVVMLAQPAAEATVREDAAPPFADQGGADQARRILGWEAPEEVFDEIVRQSFDEIVLSWRLRRHCAPRVGVED